MSVKPQIIMSDYEPGRHNSDWDQTRERLGKAKSYQDLSTICLIPSPTGYIHTRVAQNMMNIMAPMNQKFFRIFINNMEVGEGYSSTIDNILANPELSNWKYILTWEWDNLVPSDGLLKLYESVDKYDIIGGIYFTKGEGGQPMCYGNVNEFPVNFKPFLPPADSVTPCRGTAMGFTLYKMDIFKNPNIPRPFFKTVQEVSNGGARAYTQDLYFAENAGKAGYKSAIDSRVRVGHYDIQNDIVW